MSEELRDQIDQAVAAAIFGDGDLDEIERILADAQDRLDAARAYKEGGR
jgi:hypothetical protein